MAGIDFHRNIIKNCILGFNRVDNLLIRSNQKSILPTSTEKICSLVIGYMVIVKN